MGQLGTDEAVKADIGFCGLYLEFPVHLWWDTDREFPRVMRGGLYCLLLSPPSLIDFRDLK